MIINSIVQNSQGGGGGGTSNAYFATVAAIEDNTITLTNGSTAIKCVQCFVDDIVVIITTIDNQNAAIAVLGGAQGGGEIYDGETVVTPEWSPQTLQTYGKIMDDNIHVHKIQKTEVTTSETNGYTLFI